MVIGLRRSQWDQCGGKRRRGPKPKVAPPTKPSRAGCPWTPEEKLRLSEMWGVVDPEEIVASFGRTWGAIQKQAEKQRLSHGLPEGVVTLTEAERRLGHDRESLENIARRHGVPLRSHPCPWSAGRRRKTGVRWKCVEFAVLESAVMLEDRELETVGGAADRRGIPADTLRSWLRADGLIPPRRHGRVVSRVRTVDVDRVVASRHHPSKELVGVAARRHGVPVSTMRRWLRIAGLMTPVPRGHRLWLDPKVIDAVVNEHRGLSVEATRA